MGGQTVRREMYEELEVELIRFEAMDVITGSTESEDDETPLVPVQPKEN